MGTSSYLITEPHPSVPKSRYLYSGRGGAGNISRVDPSHLTPGQDAAGPASRAKLDSPPACNCSNSFSSGRGGAGNFHPTTERPIFSFDEELERQRRMELNQTPHYLTGRGGAGNVTSAYRQSTPSDTSSVHSREALHKSLEGSWNSFRNAFSGTSNQN